LSILRAFTSVATPPLRLQPPSARLPRRILSSQVRFSSHIVPETGHEYRNDEHEVEIDKNEVKEADWKAAELDEQAVEVSALPWYLQVDSPKRTTQPLSERQRIPDLPESPPPILEPLLQQISVDLGLDDLSLLDLRKLDPPPALGANLIMLIGTARSEKHLHVSADRLCRWLRSNYKLRPDADGLLGRNELKLKLRRKSRRAKMMGGSPADNDDDGVRTGWVCVDVGVVESPKSAAEDNALSQNFVGFGRRTDGVRIVVQMLTEGKRSDIDLEKLWRGILKRGGQVDSEEVGEVALKPKPTWQLPTREPTQKITVPASSV
jgi:hypothetical protein